MNTELADFPLLPIFLVGVAAILLAGELRIQDLDRPSSGFIRVSQQPLIDTAAATATFAE